MFLYVGIFKNRMIFYNRNCGCVETKITVWSHQTVGSFGYFVFMKFAHRHTV